jgi:DNA-binding transcriptional LysR family regulator
MNRAGLPELNAAVALAARCNYRAAAADLALSPSALSHAIRTLEQRMGVRLFNRTTRSVSLTEAGEEFLARIRPALREISDAMDGANDHRSKPIGTLRINAAEAAAQQLMNPIVLEYVRRYPDMHVDIVTDGRIIDIVAGGFDAGVRFSHAVPQDMIAISCGGPQSFAVVGSPSYFAARLVPRNPTDLVNHDCIRSRLPSGAPWKWEFEQHGEMIAMDVKGRMTLDANSLRLEAAIAGVGLAYINEWSARQAIRDGRLQRVLADWTPPFAGLCLYYPGHRHVPAGLRAFIDLLRETGQSRQS